MGKGGGVGQIGLSDDLLADLSAFSRNRGVLRHAAG
jgi:hypothetical protein